MKPTLPRLNRQSHKWIPVTSEQVHRYRLRDRLRPELLSFFVGVVEVDESWLEMPIGDGWIAAYRLIHGGGRTRVAELRVFLDDGTANRPCGESHVNLRTSQRMSGSFSFDRIRRGITERSLDTALAATRENLIRHDGALKAFGNPASRIARSSTEGRGAGRKGRPLRFYALVAVRYDEIEWDSRREPATSTRQLLKDRHYPAASLAAVSRWISVAGKLGFLTKTERGQRGRRATQLARQVSKGG